MDKLQSNSIWSDGTEVPPPVETPIETPETPVDTNLPLDTPEVPEAQAPEDTPPVDLPETPEAELDPHFDDITETPAGDKPTNELVEKIIEKYPEFESEDAKALFEAIRTGNEDEVFNYLAQKRMDYNTMSDFDVVKTGLKNEHPDWNDKRIDLEFKAKYDIKPKKDLSEINADLDPEGYEKAVSFNEAVEQKEMLLQMQAEDYRIALNEQKKNIQFPKINTAAPEQGPTAEQIAEGAKKWKESVDQVVPTVTGLSLNINGEEIVYKVTDQERAELSQTMGNFNVVDFLTKDRGWFDKDGNPNIKAITEDVYRFKNMDKMLNSVATRSKNATTKDILAQMKNVDLTPKPKPVQQQKQDAATTIWGAPN